MELKPKRIRTPDRLKKRPINGTQQAELWQSESSTKKHTDTYLKCWCNFLGNLIKQHVKKVRYVIISVCTESLHYTNISIYYYCHWKSCSPPTASSTLSVTTDRPSEAEQMYIPESETWTSVMTRSPCRSSKDLSLGRSPPSLLHCSVTGI
jgi:hypothetical protein